MRKNALFLAAALVIATATPNLAQAGAEAVVGFTPAANGQSALDVVLNSIKGAKSQILVAAYSFTSKPIAVALLEAKERGIDVKVMADKKGNMAKYSSVTFLANKGVPVRLNGNYAIMHNKYMVVDGRDVETGSFNYTQAAAKKNAENALLLRNVPGLAAAYHAEFQRLWDEAETLNPNY